MRIDQGVGAATGAALSATGAGAAAPSATFGGGAGVTAPRSGADAAAPMSLAARLLRCAGWAADAAAAPLRGAGGALGVAGGGNGWGQRRPVSSPNARVVAVVVAHRDAIRERS
jgi:hypothetical protein